MEGIPRRVKVTTNLNCSSSYPDAKNLSNVGAKIYPNTISTTATTEIMVMKLFKCLSLPSLPSLASTSLKIGIKVVLIALVNTDVNIPTADNAKKNASVFDPDPYLDAIKVSLTKPNTLLTRESTVNIATVLAAPFATLFDIHIPLSRLYILYISNSLYKVRL